MDDVRSGEGSDLLAHGLDKVLADLFAVVIAIMQRHKRIDALSLDVVIKSAQIVVKAMLSHVRLGLLAQQNQALYPEGTFLFESVLKSSQREDLRATESPERSDAMLWSADWGQQIGSTSV